MKETRKKMSTLSTVAFGTAMLVFYNGHSASSPSPDQNQLVECYGVAKSGENTPLMMTKSMCDQLPSTKQVVVNASDYVQCYGVAASGQNGCATKNNSCGGQVKAARASDAWTSLPLGVCQNLKGATLSATSAASNS